MHEPLTRRQIWSTQKVEGGFRVLQQGGKAPPGKAGTCVAGFYVVPERNSLMNQRKRAIERGCHLAQGGASPGRLLDKTHRAKMTDGKGI